MILIMSPIIFLSTKNINKAKKNHIITHVVLRSLLRGYVIRSVKVGFSFFIASFNSETVSLVLYLESEILSSNRFNV